MQNVQALPSAVAGRVNAADKIAESPPPPPPLLGFDIIKKLQHHGAVVSSSQPQETTECSRMPRVTSSRDQFSSNQGEKHFQATIVADKYLLLDQVEGSSLYRCMDVNTQEELVCKVRKITWLECDLPQIIFIPRKRWPLREFILQNSSGLHQKCFKENAEASI